MITKVKLREEGSLKEVGIVINGSELVTGDVKKGWQEIINVVTELLGVKAGLIMEITKEAMQVFLMSENKENPYVVGGNDSLCHGLYCETVIGTDGELHIENALELDAWKDNPDVKLNMISYYGLPVHFPDGKFFGTICILDDKPTTPLRSLQYTDINKLKEKHKYNKYNSFTKQKLDKHMMMSNYKYSYGKNKVIDLDIAFDDKKITFLIGKNGVGKTTFINCMCGLKKGFKGKTELNNLKFNKKGYKHCSLVMQDVTHQLFTESVYEELKLATDNEKMIADILETLKLTEKKEAHPMSLSGGEKQRVAVANAWASGKEIIIFDEPTSGLCYESMMALKSIVENLKKAGKKIIIVTHDYEFINCFDNEEIVEIYK